MVLIRFSVAFANAQFWAVLLLAPAFRGSLEWLHQPLDRLLGQEPAAALGQDLEGLHLPSPSSGHGPEAIRAGRGQGSPDPPQPAVLTSSPSLF